MTSVTDAFGTAYWWCQLIGKPLCLLIYAVLSVWPLLSEILFLKVLQPAFDPWTTLTDPAGKAQALSLFLTSVLLTTMWTTSAGLVVYRGAFNHRWTRPHRLTGIKTLMQVVDMEVRGRRRCSDCGIDQGDRVYHCEVRGRCFPMYDHYCGFYGSPIFGANKKAYLLSLPWMIIHIWFHTAVVIWAIFNVHETSWAWPCVPVVAPLLAFSFYLCYICKQQWEVQALGNGTWAEIISKPFVMFTQEDRPYNFELRGHRLRPWDMGWSENLRVGLGSAWHLLNPFIDSPQLVHWEADDAVSDWPFNRDAMSVAWHSARIWDSDYTGIGQPVDNSRSILNRTVERRSAYTDEV